MQMYCHEKIIRADGVEQKARMEYVFTHNVVYTSWVYVHI